ncbi:hypothetical protein MF271_13265 [Deinococcus sp. KNUC1210]|uniref:hypothetical protein n=1 Tax=Deinococcus sp. KNUC1210 TaxID=2917691 RepID=UPI001EF15B23|nr:hypothetical protein [Deinococcus sp. KNUC1210]ULH14933.1 hypothetical protein MF271_13265 [Deinococcus sp. KNUC1210]
MTREPGGLPSGASSEVLTWPPGLTDATPLPFIYWRVLHLIDGRRPLGLVAAALGTGEAQVRQVLGDVRAWLERQVQREQPVSDALLELVTQTLISVVGPMGRLMMDDALDELEGQPTLSVLLSTLNQELSPPQSQALLRQLRTRGIA